MTPGRNGLMQVHSCESRRYSRRIKYCSHFVNSNNTSFNNNKSFVIDKCYSFTDIYLLVRVSFEYKVCLMPVFDTMFLIHNYATDFEQYIFVNLSLECNGSVIKSRLIFRLSNSIYFRLIAPHLKKLIIEESILSFFKGEDIR